MWGYVQRDSNSTGYRHVLRCAEEGLPSNGSSITHWAATRAICIASFESTGACVPFLHVILIAEAETVQPPIFLGFYF